LGKDATAYFAKTSKKGKGQDKDKDCKQEKKTCSHCSFKGHEATECHKLKKEKEDKKKAKEKAAIASTSNSASTDSTAKAAMARVPTNEVVWLFCVGDAIFNIDFPRLGSSVVEHLVYNQGAWVQSPVWPYS
jgi:hypothetical protein